MIRNINKMIAGHVNDNSVKYFFLILCFAAGIAAGALFVGALPSEKCEELMTAISGFAAWIDDGEIKPVSTFRLSMINNLRSVALLYVCGMSLYLSALAYIHMIAKGFVIGFTVGFMSLFFGGKGFACCRVGFAAKRAACSRSCNYVGFVHKPCHSTLQIAPSWHNAHRQQKKAFKVHMLHRLDLLPDFLVSIG